jgi:protein gp37
MKNSKIEWTKHTFNPWIGCSKCSAGCDNCYACDMMDVRWKRALWGAAGTRLRTTPANWRNPLKWSKESESARVFCASLADVFENYKGDDSAPDRPVSLDAWRHDLFDLIEKTPNLEWLLLTKRPQNAAKFLRKRLPGNVWIGASVEDQKAADQRIPHLAGIPAKVRFLSCEPLLGPLDLRPHLTGVDWVIVGGESGKSPRPMDPIWVRDLRDQCVAAGVAFLFKQWGGRNRKATGRKIDGRIWNQIPMPHLAKAA